MAFPILTGFGAASESASTTAYLALGDGFAGAGTSVTEARATSATRTITTLSGMWVRITANNRGTSTFRTRVNGANGGQSASISGTGEFTDASGSDTLAVGDTVNYSCTTGSGGSTFVLSVAAVVSSARWCRQVCHSFSGAAYSAAQATQFIGIAQDLSYGNTTEAVQKQRIVATLTAQGFAVYLSAQSGATITARTRKNGANGGQSLSLSGTGVFQDVSGTDSLADGDDFNYTLETNATGAHTAHLYSCEMVPSSDVTMVAASSAWNQNNNLTQYGSPSYNGNPSTTELDKRTQIQGACTASRLGVRLDTNTVTAASTLKLRVNGASVNQSVSITASTTGQFEDASGSDVLASTDEVCYQIVTGATGTTTSSRSIRMLLTVAAGRTTHNTRSHPLGTDIGMNWRVAA